MKNNLNNFIEIFTILWELSKHKTSENTTKLKGVVHHILPKKKTKGRKELLRIINVIFTILILVIFS